MHQLFLAILVAIVALGVVGNLFVIVTVLVTKSLRVRTNVFAVNLAVADLLVTVYVMPVGMAAWVSQRTASPSAGVCALNAFLLLTSCAVSIQSLMLVAVERYVHICRHASYERWFGRRAVALYVALSWCYGAAWAAQGFTGWTRYAYNRYTHVCAFDERHSASYDACFVLFAILLPMVVLAFCYASVFRCVVHCRGKLRAARSHASVTSGSSSLMAAATARDRKRRMGRARRQLRLVCTLFVIVVAFVVFWTPNVVVFMSAVVWPTIPQYVRALAMWLAFANSSVNSVLYGVLNRNFRRGYSDLCRTVFCCATRRKRASRCCRDATGRPDDGGEARLSGASPDGGSPLTSAQRDTATTR